MTVSHVINEHPHVRSSTRDRVLQAIGDLDYRVNVAARNLRTGRTGTIGLAVPEVDSSYSGHLGAAISAAAADRGYRVLIEQTGASREGELDALALSRNRLYDGLILSAVGIGPADAEQLRVDFPVVLLGERLFDGPLDHVAMPNVDGARAATAHLVARGCRRIAFFDGEIRDDVSVSSLRAQGYREALRDAGLGFDESLVVDIGPFTMRSGAECARALVDDGVEVDGIFCVTDTVAIGALRGLADRGLRVPQDVKVIGFDDIDEASYSVPSLSTIDPDHGSIARKAVELLTARINGAKAAPQDITVPFRLIDRESTAR